MFIYEFMSGVADTITRDDEDETSPFDPHQHRKVEKPTSYSETMIHLLKGSIGAGILCMPDAMSRVGLLVGIPGMVSIGLFATYCIQLLIAAQYEICTRARRGYLTYPASMRAALAVGPVGLRCAARPLGVAVDVVMVLWQIGICCIYGVFVAENIKLVCDYYGLELALRMHMLLALPPLLLINMMKDLKVLTPLSSISNAVTILGLLLVFFYLIENDVDVKPSMVSPKELGGVPVFIGITLFALEAVGVILALEYNMEEPKKFVGACGLFNVGMIIIMTLYVLVGVFGYLKYGDDIKASITLNLPFEQKKAQAAKVIFSLAIFLTHPLQNFVAYNICWRKIKKRMSLDSNHIFVDYMLRILLVLVPWGIGVLVPQLGPFVSLFGAFCLSLLAIVFPAILDCCLRWQETGALARCKRWRDYGIMVVGMICLASGVYTSVLEIVHESSKEAAHGEPSSEYEFYPADVDPDLSNQY